MPPGPRVPSGQSVNKRKSLALRPPIVAFSNIDWRGLANPVEPRLIGLAQRGWPVVHSNGALSFWDRGKPAWQAAGWLGRFESLDGVVIDRAGRWPPRWPTSKLWDGLAIRRHARRLRKACEVGEGMGPIAFLFHPNFYPYVEALNASHVVFQAIDNYAYQPGWSEDQDKLLNALVERADLLLVNSDSMVKLLPECGRAKSKLLPSGVDFERVASGYRARCPADLDRIPRPRIGYTGRINPKIDFPMIAEVARRRPDWHWVLIGPINMSDDSEHMRAVQSAWHECERLPNVTLLGYKEPHAIPAYLAHMDILALCYRKSAGFWTQAAYPFKIHECLATGRPVISADMVEVRRHSDVMDFADSVAEWIDAIERALQGDGIGTKESRQKVAAQNSWGKRIDLLDAWLQEMVDGSRQGYHD
jgi:glycosyltransferase involved in cell wall biosynthesis